MSTRFSRRTAVAAAIGTPLALLSGRMTEAAPSISELPASSTGYFTVDEGDAILIGLLLPAVRKPRLDARFQLADGSGQVILSIPLEGGRAWFFDIVRETGGVTNGPIDPSYVVTERSTGQVWKTLPAGNLLIGLLLPAVQNNGKSAGLLAGSAQLLCDQDVEHILPFVAQDSATLNGDSAGLSFVGPFTSPVGVSSLIGLLLPAVQGNFTPHQLLLLNSSGDPIVRAGIIGPENKLGTFAALFDAFYDGNGVVRVDQRMADGSVKPVGEGKSTDGILIGLLLPAVQDNGRPVGILGGSVQAGDMTVGFQPSTAAA